MSIFYFVSHIAIGFFGGAAYLSMHAGILEKPLWQSSGWGRVFLGITSALASLGMVFAVFFIFDKYGLWWGLATIGEIFLGALLVRLVPYDIRAISSVVAPVILVVIFGALFEFYYIEPNLFNFATLIVFGSLAYGIFRVRKQEINKVAPLNPVSTTPESDDNNLLYQQAFIELENDEKVVAIWSRSFAEAGGDEQKAKALYIQHRVEILKTEILANAELKEMERREEAISVEQAAHDARKNIRNSRFKTFVALILFFGVMGLIILFLFYNSVDSLNEFYLRIYKN